MNLNNVKRQLKQITDNCTGIKIFLLNNENLIFDCDMENGTLDEFRKDFTLNLIDKYVNNEKFSSPKLSDSDDRKNALYQFDFDSNEQPHEFSFLKNANSIKANKRLKLYPAKNGFNDLRGIIIRLKNSTGKVISFYQHIHNLSIVTPQKGLFLTTHKTRVIKLEHDVLRLGNNFVFACIDDLFLVENVNAFEKELGFDKVIHSKATAFAKDLQKTDLIEDMATFTQRMDSETSFAKKFVKVFKNSAVIEQGLPNKDIINFAMSKQYYSDRLRLNEDNNKFNLSSISRCNAFLTLLDDEFLKSELTGQDYIARAKDRAN
ncbi:anti-phage protein KwaB [Shewanella algae]|uniref:anti-phage protein KwaB n=1 Tax=Shewanella algae TaxID=38313 RepID=UPI0031F549C2